MESYPAGSSNQAVISGLLNAGGGLGQWFQHYIANVSRQVGLPDATIPISFRIYGPEVQMIVLSRVQTRLPTTGRLE